MGARAPRPPSRADVAVVAIGRNEGDRLRRCFESLPRDLRGVVYVDSGSTDGSVAEARGRGFEVVLLDRGVPFTAARARNAGIARARERWPELRVVQLVDGDCVVAAGWIDAALEVLTSAPDVAIVCGRRREARPDASVYNRLCDIEWDTPVGDALACGGDAAARVEALAEVGGYADRLIAGEEPELCARLRARGWRVRRVDREMTLHDAAMTRFGQWWRRTSRAGHAFAEVSALHPGLWTRNLRSCLAYGLALPALAALAAPLTRGWSLLLLAAYPLLWVRIARGQRRRAASLGDAALYAAFCVLGKPAEASGALRYWANRTRGRRSALIEYK